MKKSTLHLILGLGIIFIPGPIMIIVSGSTLYAFLIGFIGIGFFIQGLRLKNKEDELEDKIND